MPLPPKAGCYKVKKTLLAILIITSAVPLLAQDHITLEDSKFFFRNERINAADIKTLVYATGDSVAIGHYRSYSTEMLVGVPLMLAGTGLVLAAGAESIANYAVCDIYFNSLDGDCKKAPTALWVTGLLSLGTGTVLIIAARKKLISSTVRYNELQSNHVLLEIGANKVGLVYRF